MAALLCETVTGDTMAELVSARDAAASLNADMVELRLDGVRDLDVERALLRRPGAVIVTCRPAWEGGRFSGSEEDRKAILMRAVAAGAEFIDVEWNAAFDDLVHAHKTKVVLSSHDFAGVPADLCTRVRTMRATGASVIKVAVTAARLSDTLPLLEIARGGDAVVIGMGAPGVPTRLLATRFGSRWTYAGNNVAPGQIPAARMLDEFRFRSITEQTALYGVAGEDVLKSPIPARRNAAFAEAGRDAVCVPLPTADAADIRTFTEALGFTGWDRCTS